MDRRTLARRANRLLAETGVSRKLLAEEAGVSVASLKTALAPSTADRMAALPTYLHALADAMDRRADVLREVAGQLRELAGQRERDQLTLNL